MIPLSQFVETLIGEEPFSGYPCVLIRLANCNLSCAWCDTREKLFVSEEIEPKELAERAMKTGRNWALVTGGEPLICEDIYSLLDELIARKLSILLETNGSILIDKISKKVVLSVDIKTPSSGFAGSFLDKNIHHIKKTDWFKFVIADKNDFDWALDEIDRLNLFKKAGVIFSPVFGKMNPHELARMILKTKKQIRLSLQMHKIIGVE